MDGFRLFVAVTQHGSGEDVKPEHIMMQIRMRWAHPRDGNLA